MLRFKESESDDHDTVPLKVGKIGEPEKKEYHSNEVQAKAIKLSASSIYTHYKNGKLHESFDPWNVVKPGFFWCSAGNHNIHEEVNYQVEFEKHYRLNAMWIQWAFAPGEFRIKFSNDKITWFDLFNGYRYSIKNGDLDWWKSILSNPKTRWNYMSFDERINFDSPVWAKYVEISMKIPVNQYFGIYNFEFYTKNKSIVMLKSKSPKDNLCLTVVNGVNVNKSPVLGKLFIIFSIRLFTNYIIW